LKHTMHCAAVIPCFNEAATIAAVIADVHRHLSKIIVVDDGSTDDTAQKAEAASAEVIRLPKNSGKGVALQIGWRHARKLGFDWALMLDGDGQHSADDIPHFFSCIEKTGAKLIVGNRMENFKAMPLIRRYVNRWMSRRLSKITGAELPDSQCGFRLAHLETLLNLPISADHFEIESEMLVEFIAAGDIVQFVPIQTIYKNQKSRIRPMVDGKRWFRWLKTLETRRKNFTPVPLFRGSLANGERVSGDVICATPSPQSGGCVRV